jgi:membrane protein
VRHDAREAGYAAWLALRRLQQSDDLTFASSIAFYALLSLFPIFLLLFAFIGRVTSDPAAHAAVIDLVLQYFPDRLEFISTELGEAQNASFRLGVAGSLVVVWSALGVFRAISSAVDHAWSVETRRSFLRHQASAFLMLVAAGLVMVAALVVASVAEVMATSWFGRLLDGAPGLSQFTQITLRYPATLLLTVVVSLILYFVPNTTVRVRDIWLGALLTGVLWRLALSAFSWYLGLGGFSVLGSLAAIVVFLLWVYVSAVILLYGVEFTAALARLRRPDRAEAGQAAPLSVS